MTSSTPPRTAAGLSSSSEAPGSGRRPISSVIDNAPRLRPPRSLPPWIATYDERHGSVTEEQLRLLNPPAPTVRPQHKTVPQDLQRRVSKDGFVAWEDPRLGPAQGVRARIPHFLRYGRASMRGRKWDHLRTAEPVILSAYSCATMRSPAAWDEFLQSSAWGHMPNEKSEIVDADFLRQLQPTFHEEVDVPLHLFDPRQDRRRESAKMHKRVWKQVMRSSLYPLLFRLGVIVTSTLALGIATQIYKLEDAASRDSADRTQSLVAVVVDCVAIPFNGYMIYDEYTGKPLGLRSAVSKISLILLDLFFIIFKSASTALAFESVVYHSLGGHAVRAFSKILAAFMLLGLLSWTMNFTVNIFRVVERLGGREDDGTRG